MGIIGDFPKTCIYKAYAEREYAESLINFGRFRMGGLNQYRETEDKKRNDRHEGTARYRTAGPITQVSIKNGDLDAAVTTTIEGLMNHHVHFANPVYIFSTSMENVELDYIKTQFGPYIVQINEPEQFALDIAQHFNTRAEKFMKVIECLPVSYNRNDVLNSEVDNLDTMPLSYSQKSESFSEESEFRYVAVSTDDPPNRLDADYLEIDLGKLLPYAKLLEE